MEYERREILRAAGLAGLSALLAPGAAAACWGRGRRVAFRAPACGTIMPCATAPTGGTIIPCAIACANITGADTSLNSGATYTARVNWPIILFGNGLYNHDPSGNSFAVTVVDTTNSAIVSFIEPAQHAGPVSQYSGGLDGLPIYMNFQYKNGVPPSSHTGTLSFSLTYTGVGKICAVSWPIESIRYG